MEFEQVNTGQLGSDSAETRVRAMLADLEADQRRLALLALSEVEAAVRSKPQLAEPIAMGLFHVLGGLQVPSWGYWRGLLDAIRNTRIRVLRELDAELTKPLAQSARLESLFEVLDRRVEPETFRRLSALLEACKFSGKSATVGALVGVPVRFRNFVAHQLPAAGSGWWKDAEAALQPLLQLRTSDAFGLREHLEAGFPQPWCLTREGTRFTYNGLGSDSSAHYVPDDSSQSPIDDVEGGTAVLRSIALLAAKPLQNERDIGRWLRKLAPEEFKGVMVDDFLVGRPVGVGGFATVHVARQLSTGRKVALKILRDSVATEDLARFQKDAEYLSLFNHPNVAQVLAYGEDTWLESRKSDLAGERWYEVLFKKGKPVKHWIALEWIDGESLEQVYRRLKGGLEPTIESEEKTLMEELGLVAPSAPDSSQLPDHATLIEWMRQAANALSAVHATGLIHRDVKPSNLMVGTDGTVKLIDFGVARRQHALRTILTAADQNPGTMAYKAPEQLSALGAEQRVGPASDVYSLCASFYELFGRCRLFDWPEDAARSSEGRLDETSYRKRENKHRPPRVRIDDPKCGHELEVLVMGGLEPEPGQRPTAQQLKEDIDRAKANRPIDYQPPATWRRLQLAYRRYRTVANLTAVFALAGLLGLASYLHAISAEQDRTLEARKLADRNAKEANDNAKSAAENARIAQENAENAEQNARDARASEGRAKASEVKAREAEQEAQVQLLAANRHLAYVHRQAADVSMKARRYQAALLQYGEAVRLDASCLPTATWSSAVCSGGRPLWSTGRRGPEFQAPACLSPAGRLTLCSVGTDAVLLDLGTGEVMRVYTGHTDRLTRIMFHPDGKSFLTLSLDSTARVWNTNSGNEVFSLIGHEAGVRSACFSADGRFIATGGGDNTVRVWDAANGSALQILRGHDHIVGAVAFSPDSRLIISGSADRTIRQWSVDSGILLHSLDTATSTRAVRFSPDGRYFASAGSEGEVVLWSASERTPVRHFAGHSGIVIDVNFDHNGSRLVSACLDGTVRIWSVETGREIVCCAGHTLGAYYAAFTTDDQWLVSTGFDRVLRVWDCTTGQCVCTHEGHTPNSVAFSPSGQLIVSAGVDGTIRLWNATTGAQVKCIVGHRLAAYVAYFSLDGRHIVSIGQDDALRVWEVDTGLQLMHITVSGDALTCCAISPNGRYAATGTEEGYVRLWDMESGIEIRSFSGHESTVNSVAFSPSGGLIVSGSDDDTARLWEVSTGRTLRILKGHKLGVGSVAFSPNGLHVLTGSWDKTSCMWDVATGAELLRFDGHGDAVTCVQFSPDGRLAASGSWDGTVRLWDVATGRELRRLEGHTNGISSIAFSPDGHFVLSGGRDQAINLWEGGPSGGKRVWCHSQGALWSLAVSPSGHHVIVGGAGGTALALDGDTWRTAFRSAVDCELIMGADISPDNQFAAIAGTDGLIRIYSLETGMEVKTLGGHSLLCFSIEFSPDGRMLISAGGDGSVRLWSVDSASQIRYLHDADEGDFCVGAHFSPDGKQAIALRMGENKVLVWDMRAEVAVKVLESDRDLHCAAMSPRGDYFVAGGDGGLLQWRLVDLSLQRTFVDQSRRGSARCAAYSSCGDYLITGDHDGTIHIWNVESGEELAWFTGHHEMVTAVEFCSDGSKALSVGEDGTLCEWDIYAVLACRTMPVSAKSFLSRCVSGFALEGLSPQVDAPYFPGSTWDTPTKLAPEVFRRPLPNWLESETTQSQQLEPDRLATEWLDEWGKHRTLKLRNAMESYFVTWCERFEGYRYREEPDQSGVLRRVHVQPRPKDGSGRCIGEPEGHIDYARWWDETQAPRVLPSNSNEDDSPKSSSND